MLRRSFLKAVASTVFVVLSRVYDPGFVREVLVPRARRVVAPLLFLDPVRGEEELAHGLTQPAWEQSASCPFSGSADPAATVVPLDPYTLEQVGPRMGYAEGMTSPWEHRPRLKEDL